jgi:hypothetical protein
VKIKLICLLTLFIPSLLIGQHKWLGGTGNYNDPAMWDVGSVPDRHDDVIIGGGTVIFPASGTYEALSFTADNCTLDFKGNNLTSADLDIYGNLIVIQVTTVYEMFSNSTWEFKGQGTNHELKVDGVDLNYVRMDEESSQIELLTPLIASNSFAIKNGDLVTNGFDMDVGRFLVGGGCNGANCLVKNLHLGGSTINCTSNWNAEFNYGSVNITGSHLIIAPQFNGGVNIDYDQIQLTDYEAGSVLSDQNLYSRNNSFNKLIIDNTFNTKIAGDITINQEFKVNHPNTEIFVSKEGNSTTERWTFEGVVNLPIDQGGCLDFTTFTRTSAASSNFDFYSTSSNLIFDFAIIKGIPTSGGGSFTVSNGYVAGYNNTWSTTNPNPSKTLFWIGGSGEWNDGNHWSLSSGGSAYGCAPSIVDNVIFDGNSFTGSGQSVSLRYDELNICKSISWTSNPHNAEMSPIIQNFNYPDLFIAGGINISAPVNIDLGSGFFRFISNDEVGISSVSDLPRLGFESESGYYLLGSDLNCERITFSAGGLDTEGFDIDANGFFCDSNDPKSFVFNDSKITINGNLNLGDLQDGNVTVDPGTSHLECNTFQSIENTYNIVEINNTTENDIVFPVTIRKLILNGSSVRMTQSGIILDSLVINSDNADLKYPFPYVSVIRKAIVSNAPGIDPPEIRAYTSSAVSLEFESFNTCITGPIAFMNINAVGNGQVNAPQGIDNGGNTGINFSPTLPYTGLLYWIGGQEYWATKSNWSTSSGGCPANNDPKVADQLVFDDQSFMDGDTIFIDAYRECKEMLFVNSTTTPVLYLGRRLVPDEVIIDGGRARIANNTSVQPFASLWVDEGMQVINGGSLYLDNSELVVGRRSSLLTTPALLVGQGSVMSGIASEVGIAGASNVIGMKTVDIHENALINFLNIDFSIVPPISGQPLRDMNLDFSGKTLKSLTTYVSGTSQQYSFIDDVVIKQMNHQYGDIEILPNVIVRVEE